MTTAAEEEHMGRVAALGCALCAHFGIGGSPAEVHHMRTGTGAGRRASHFETIPLCTFHHRGAGGIHGMGRKAFEREYDITELALLEQTRRALQC